MITKKMLCFDMDGTIADLYAVPNWLEKLRKGDPSPFQDAAPMWDMKALRNALLNAINKGWEVRVITWLPPESPPEYKKAVTAAKKEWLARHKFPAHKYHCVAYGTTKAKCVFRSFYEPPFILFDDNDKIRNGWHLGDTVDPQTTNIIEYINNLD
ncbi:hypothetical protein [Barnesiella intestinihominis]|uniref:hypothetical protein n=1 Tax=Barnesiella intestinihominis TaxID=487174 RepID=UPI003AB00F1E